MTPSPTVTPKSNEIVFVSNKKTCFVEFLNETITFRNYCKYYSQGSVSIIYRVLGASHTHTYCLTIKCLFGTRSGFGLSLFLQNHYSPPKKVVLAHLYLQYHIFRNPPTTSCVTPSMNSPSPLSTKSLQFFQCNVKYFFLFSPAPRFSN